MLDWPSGDRYASHGCQHGACCMVLPSCYRRSPCLTESMSGLVAGHCYALLADPRSRGSWGRSCWALSGGRCCRRRMRGARTIMERWTTVCQTARWLRCRCSWMCARRYGRRWAVLSLSRLCLSLRLDLQPFGALRKAFAVCVVHGFLQRILSPLQGSCLSCYMPVMNEHACDAPDVQTMSMLKRYSHMTQDLPVELRAGRAPRESRRSCSRRRAAGIAWRRVCGS